MAELPSFQGAESRCSAASEPVVPLVFPVAPGVSIGNENGLDVFWILVTELGRHAQLHRKAVFRRQGLAVVSERQQGLWMQRPRHVDAGVVVVGTFEANIFGTQIGADPAEKAGEGTPAQLPEAIQ